MNDSNFFFFFLSMLKIILFSNAGFYFNLNIISSILILIKINFYNKLNLGVLNK